MPKKLVLIDGNALVHRAFHALPPLNSPKGVLTNAVFGFTSILFKMIKELKPDYIISTFDLAGPTFRHEEFEDYKAHREKAPDELYAQIPLIKALLTKMGIKIYEKQGFEADDLIGTLAEKAKKNPPAGGLQTIIVTGDLDTLQLVEKDKVVVFTLKKGITDTVIYNEKEIKNRYNLTPEQLLDFKGLKGDPSDNIPGVPGVGEKTASTLIQEYKTLENLYKKLEDNTHSKISPKLKEKLLENKDQAFFSKKLATIYRDVDIDFKLKDTEWREDLDKDGLVNMLKDFGFSSLVKRLSEIDVATEEAPVQPTLYAETESITRLKGNTAIKKGLDGLAKGNEVLFNISDGIFNYTTDNKSYFGFDLGDLMVSKSGSDELWKKFVSIFEDPSILKTGHDLKPLLKKFLEKEIHVKGVEFDTKIAAYLLKPDRKDYELEMMYRNEFGEEIQPGEIGHFKAIIKLRDLFTEHLKSNDLFEILTDIEMPLITVLAEMELTGVKIDLKSLKKLSESVNKKLIKLEKDIYGHAGTQFNINSPQQLKEVLFERLGLKGKVRKTAKGALSTAAGELEKLIDEHPIIDLILKYRELQKLKTTYIDPFPHLIDPKTERLHTTFNQTGTVTGRLSSQDPNLQNVPIRTELGQEFRKAFVAEKGYELVSFDYSQLELRIAAHISGDPKMKDAFKKGEDIHTRTAAEIFEIDPKDVTPDMRREAKVMNFGLLYGMGILGFQRASGVSRDKAREFIDRYMEEFEGIAKYMEDMKIKAKKDGYVSTLYGRRRYLPELKSGMFQLVAQAERMAINMPIQGTEGDLLRIAMNKISDLIHKEYSDKNIRMLIQVHDELLFEVKKDLIKTVSPKIKELMESSIKLDVPLTVDVKYGDNWQEMKPF